MDYKETMDYFYARCKGALSGIIVSLKQNLRIINKTTNIYQHFDANGTRVYEKQKIGDSWAIRKPMHKDTVFGSGKFKKGKRWYAYLSLWILLL